jgi:hypothetical protein
MAGYSKDDGVDDIKDMMTLLAAKEKKGMFGS